MKVEKPNAVMPVMPMMPEVLDRAMPVHVPQLEYDTSMFKGFLHNWKLGQLSKASEREAEVAVNKKTLVEANLGCIEAITTFSARLQTTFVELETKRRGFELDVSIKEAELNEQQMKNYLLRMEVENAELDLKTKKKELGAE